MPEALAAGRRNAQHQSRGEASLLRRAVALLLAGALTVVGLPGCGGGGPSNQVNEDEQWEPSASFTGVDDEVVYYHAPMLGTPTIQTDETGAVHNRQSSTPYGIRTGHEGRSSDEFKFTGKEWDDDLDLVYFGARYYDPELGTWLSVDPLVLWGDDGSLSPFDQNPLAYVGGRVTLAVDEFGFEGFEVRERGLSMDEGKELQGSEGSDGAQLGADVGQLGNSVADFLEQAGEAGVNLDELMLFQTVERDDGSVEIQPLMTGSEYLDGLQAETSDDATANRIEGAIKAGGAAYALAGVVMVGSAGTGTLIAVGILAASSGLSGLYSVATGRESSTVLAESVGALSRASGATDEMARSHETAVATMEMVASLALGGISAGRSYTQALDEVTETAFTESRKASAHFAQELFNAPFVMTADQIGKAIAE
jgi:RHS repeat-associated protein